MRSGVNCTRLKSRSSDAARALTNKVFATPGTPSSSTCPRTSRATTNAVTTRSWPTTALATSSRTRKTASRGPSSAATGHLSSQGLGRPCDVDELTFVRGRRPREHVAHFVDRCRRPSSDARSHVVDRCFRTEAKAGRELAPGALTDQIRGALTRPVALEETTDRRDQLRAGDLDRHRLRYRPTEA